MASNNKTSVESHDTVDLDIPKGNVAVDVYVIDWLVHPTISRINLTFQLLVHVSQQSLHLKFSISKAILSHLTHF